MDGDGVPDLLIGAPGGAGPRVPGAAYVVSGAATGEVALSDAMVRLLGEAELDGAGFAASAAGDVNGDGHDDLLVGAYGADAGGTDAGIAYVVYGPISGDVDLSGADARLIGEEPGDQAGYAVGPAGDVESDGYADLLIGAPGADVGGVDAGVVYLVRGPVAGDVDLSGADARLTGVAAGEELGSALLLTPPGDLDGDALPDLVAGAPYADVDGTRNGAVYVVRGPVWGDRSVATADARLTGEQADDEAGSALDVRDLDGDGVSDLVVGAGGSLSGIDGTAYVVYGPFAGDTPLAAADVRLHGEVGLGASAGISVAVLGDGDGDGGWDLLVGTYSDGVYFLRGPVSGDVDLVDADGWVGDAGWPLAAPGDLDGDGYDDALLGAPTDNLVYVVRGGPGL